MNRLCIPELAMCRNIFDGLVKILYTKWLPIGTIMLACFTNV